MTDDGATGRPTVWGRRQMLVGAGAVGVAGVLGACGGGDDSSALDDTAVPDDPVEPTQPADSTDPVEDEPDDDPADEGDDDGDDQDDDGDGAEVLVAAAEVPVGAGVVLAAEGVVVTQPSDGEFKAYSSTCTHEGCPVSDVADGLIRCPCHGSRFHIDDGSVANGPAVSPLPEVAIAVDGDRIIRA